jgi:hypothetical protein
MARLTEKDFLAHVAECKELTSIGVFLLAKKVI